MDDPEITDLGVKQAQALADFLLKGDPRGGRLNGSGSSSGFGLTHLYSSYMVRSVKTGTIVARSLGLPLKGWQEIHEHGGIYLENYETGELVHRPGKGRDYFSEHYPEFVLHEGFIDTGWWDHRPRETFQECDLRASSFIEALLSRHGGSQDRVGIISHGGFYNHLLAALLGTGFFEGRWFTLFNTAISRFDFHQDRVEVVYQNRTDHLPAGWIT